MESPAADTTAVTIGWAVAFLAAALTLVAFTWVAERCTDVGLVTGKDRRASTSKFQAVIWTYAVGFALFAFLWAWVVDQVATEVWSSKDWQGEISASLGSAFEHLTDQLDETYLLLLGVPLGTAVTAKAITQTKVASGAVVKAPKTEAGAPETAGQSTSAVQELVQDDNGNADLGDFQYLMFNGLAVLYFLAQFVPHPAKGLPDLPDTLVGLTSVAAAAYVAKKGVFREPPILFSVLPPAAPGGAIVTLYGERLSLTAAAADTPALSQVVFGSSPAESVELVAGAEEQLKATVPRQAPTGPVKVRVIRPPGAASDEVAFEVLAAQPKITSLVPPRVSANAEATIMVNGTGFLDPSTAEATESNRVTLDGRVLESQGTWQRDRVSVVVRGLAAGEHKVVVHDWLGRPSEPEVEGRDILTVDETN